jgi:SAM-dependent methyltransferase
VSSELLITTCVCGERDAELIGRKDERSVGRCKSCGLVRTLERAESYEELYTVGDLYHVDRAGQIPYRERYEHDYGIAATRLPKLINQFSLLDVGCANGAFVKYASQQGYKACGLEPNPRMAAWARARTGCTIYESWSEVRGAPFDIMTFHDVWEHVVDPIEEIALVRDYLDRGSLLILDVPDAEDPRFAKEGMAWRHMKPKEHLTFWDRKNLTKFLENNGFYIQSIDQPILGKLVVYARMMDV